MLRYDARTGRLIFPRLHEGGQKDLVSDPARFKVVRAGRRWGKTYAAAWLALRKLLEGKRIWWVAPSAKVAEEGWQYIISARETLEDAFGKKNVRVRLGAHRLIALPEIGGVIEFRSADPGKADQTLRGSGLDFLIIDEAAMVGDRIWYEILRPSLVDRVGDAYIMSTPKGHNWFRSLCERANKIEGYKHFHFTSYDNPHLSKEELDRLRLEMDPIAFRQEILAEFIEYDEKVFIVSEDVIGDWEELPPMEGFYYIAGVDWGRIHDYTAVVIIEWDPLRDVQRVALARRIDHGAYSDQLDILTGLLRRYKPFAVVSENVSTGLPLTEAMAERGFPIIEFHMNAKSKHDAVVALQMAMEGRKLLIPRNGDLIEELREYRCIVKPSGIRVYRARRGCYDDLVDALMMAYWQTQDQPMVL